MSLQGSLRQLGLADVLQTALAGRHGNLVLRRGATRAVVRVEGEQLYLLYPDPISPEVLLDGFLHRGLVSAEALSAHQAKVDDPLKLVEMMWQRGALPREEIEAVLRGTAEDAILDLLAWPDGQFRFDEGEPAPMQPGLVARIGVDLGGVLLRAAQRLDEHNTIVEELGTHAVLFLPLAGVPPVDFEGDPTPTVHVLLDGQRVIDEIAVLCGLTRFQVLRCMLACVRADAARLPTEEELAQHVDARQAAGQPAVARALLLQWAELDPDDGRPLEMLVDLARQMGASEDQADALQALGSVLLRLDRPAEAESAFRQLCELRPGDEVALRCLCEAAAASGNAQAYQKSTLQLATAALEADDPEKAAELLETIVQSPDAPLSARVLRSKALVRLKKRDQLLLEAEVASAVLGRRARRRDERDAAAFFRDAIASIAPERSDLLRRFRSLAEGSPRARQRVGLLAALLVLAGTAGFVLWPKRPTALLAEVRAAWSAGREDEAQRLTALLAEKYPESLEAEEAFQLQSRHLADRTAASMERLPEDVRQEVEIVLNAAERTAGKLPDPEAREALDRLAEVLDRPAVHDLRPRLLGRLEERLVAELDRLDRVILTRRDVLGRAALLAEGNGDPEVLRAYLKRAEACLEDAFDQDVERTLESVTRIAALHATEGLQTSLRRVRSSKDLLDRGASRFLDDVAACRRLLALREIETQYDRCRSEAVRALTNGQLDEAETHYRRLEKMVREAERNPELRPVYAEIQKRRIPLFLQERLSVLLEIQHSLEGARAAEEAGDLVRAVDAYRAVAEKFWFVRFENVIRLPIKVTSTPLAARVVLNGQEMGTTPLVLHYPWATQNTVTVEQTGYASETRLLGSQKDEPEAELAIALQPFRRWTAAVEATQALAPIVCDKDLIVCDRSGRITRRDRSDGRVRWARHIRSLEGILGLPATSGHLLAVPILDGRLAFLKIGDGRVLSEEPIGRPVGDVAALDDVFVVASLDGRVLGFRGVDRIFEQPLGGEGRLTAGLVAAHGVVWAGLSSGDLVRISSKGEIRGSALPGRRADVIGITAFADGLLVAKHDGALVCLDRDGEERWHATDLGSVEGAPAVAGAIAATVDGRGRVLLFSRDKGAPLGLVDLAGPTQGGLCSVGPYLAAILRDGRLWIYDPTAEREVAHVSLRGAARFPLLAVSTREIAASADGDQLTLLEVPAP